MACWGLYRVVVVRHLHMAHIGDAHRTGMVKVQPGGVRKVSQTGRDGCLEHFEAWQGWDMVQNGGGESQIGLVVGWMGQNTFQIWNFHRLTYLAPQVKGFCRKVNQRVFLGKNCYWKCDFHRNQEDSVKNHRKSNRKGGGSQQVFRRQ